MKRHFPPRRGVHTVDGVTELLTTPSAPATPREARVSAGPVGLVLGGAVFVQSGAAVAALLFPRAGVAGVVTLRLVVAAVVLLAVTRPRLRGHRRADLLAQENEAWAAGYKQGREDVITIVPHITAQQRLLAQDRTTDAAGMTGCA